MELALALFALAAFVEARRTEDEIWMRKYLETLRIAETSPLKGAACSMNSQNLPSIDEREFFVCKKPSDDRRHWPWPEIGLYAKERCKSGYLFSPRFRICRKARTVRRQQVEICIQYPSVCNQGGGQPVQPIYPVQPVQPVRPIQPIYPVTQRPVVPRPCPLAGGATGSGQPGGTCSWMMEKLASNSGDPYSFLQCAPSGPPGQYCGSWVKMPCAKGTRFGVNEQVCVHDERGGSGGGFGGQGGMGGGSGGSGGAVINISISCGGGQKAVGFCGQGRQCPGFSSCNQQSNTCCQQQQSSNSFGYS